MHTSSERPTFFCVPRPRERPAWAPNRELAPADRDIYTPRMHTHTQRAHVHAGMIDVKPPGCLHHTTPCTHTRRVGVVHPTLLLQGAPREVCDLRGPSLGAHNTPRHPGLGDTTHEPAPTQKPHNMTPKLENVRWGSVCSPDPAHAPEHPRRGSSLSKAWRQSTQQTAQHPGAPQSDVPLRTLWNFENGYGIVSKHTCPCACNRLSYAIVTC